MARPEKNTVKYFPHAVQHGRKMHYIEERYGNDGYSTWFKMLEELGKTNHHYLDLRELTTLMYLSSRCKVDEKKLLEIIEDLVKMGEFNEDLWNKRKVLWCQKFIDEIEDAYKRRSTQCWQLRDLLVHLRIRSGVNVGGNGKKDDNKPHTILDKTKVDKTKVDKSKKEHAFNDSEYYDFKLFEENIGDKYQAFNLEFYYESVKNWSESGGNKKIDWLATARGFMTRDYGDGKAMLKKGITLNQKDDSKMIKLMEQSERIKARLLKDY